jgi:hypothetical protein
MQFVWRNSPPMSHPPRELQSGTTWIAPRAWAREIERSDSCGRNPCAEPGGGGVLTETNDREVARMAGRRFSSATWRANTKIPPGFEGRARMYRCGTPEYASNRLHRSSQPCFHGQTASGHPHLIDPVGHSTVSAPGPRPRAGKRLLVSKHAFQASSVFSL